MNCTPKLQKNKTKKQWHQSSVSQRLAQNSLWSKITEMLKLALNSQRMFQDLFTHSFFSSSLNIWGLSRKNNSSWPDRLHLAPVEAEEVVVVGVPLNLLTWPLLTVSHNPLRGAYGFWGWNVTDPTPPSPGWYGSSVWLCLPSLCFQRWSLLWAARCENPPSFQSFSG